MLVVTSIARYRRLAVIVSLLLLLRVTFCACSHFNRKVLSACCYCYELRFVLVVTSIARYRRLAVIVILLLLLRVTFCACSHSNRKVSSACCYC